VLYLFIVNSLCSNDLVVVDCSFYIGSCFFQLLFWTLMIINKKWYTPAHRITGL
jgi:hypothetical protein